MDRATIVASLPTGPRQPVEGSPPRRLGSVRRTTSIDERWDDFGQPRTVRAAGRDLVTGLDGSTVVRDEASLELTTDGLGNVATIRTVPEVVALEQLVGTGTRSGFRGVVELVAGEHVRPDTVLHQLLDDVPLAALIASYGLTREHPEWNIPPEAHARLRNLCAGWEDGATMMATLDATGVFPIPEGPPAPGLVSDDDPTGWHDLAPMEPRTVRRVRRLDTWRSTSEIVVEAYFRDSHLGAAGPEDVLHEYSVTLALHPGNSPGESLRVHSIAAVPHTLPWPECPGAVASVQRVVGSSIADLAQVVSATFTGTSTCSHLNDLLRSVSGVADLAAQLPLTDADSTTAAEAP